MKGQRLLKKAGCSVYRLSIFKFSLRPFVGGERHVAKMKPYLIFVTVLANFCCHGVFGKSLAGFDEPMDGKDQAGSPRFLPGLPGGQPVSQPSTTSNQPQTPNYPSYSPPQTNYQQSYPTKNTGYQPPSVQGYPSGPTYPGPSTPPAVVPTPVPNVPGTRY